MTNRALIPFKLKPHLVTYFYKEMSGHNGEYMGKKVKVVEVSMTSAIGTFIRMFCEKADAPIKPNKYNIFLSVPAVLGKKYNEGSVYACACGRNTALMLPPEFIEDLNNIFEEFLYLSMCNYVDGTLLRAREKAPTIFAENIKGLIRTGIDEFAEKYDLYDNDILYHSLRKIYWRSREKSLKLDRLNKYRSKANKLASYTSIQKQFKFVDK